MSGAAVSLPDGRRGQALAVGMALAVLLILWLAVVWPMAGWYEDRAATLAQQRALAARMAALARALPALRRLSASVGQNRAMLLAGGSDSIAGANLQSAVQALAAQAGTSLDSAEMLPPMPAGALRRISIEVSVSAGWPVLVALLHAIDEASPRMIVDAISLNGSAPGGSGALAAEFSVSAFRSGS